jgi:hypothetical protein
MIMHIGRLILVIPILVGGCGPRTSPVPLMESGEGFDEAGVAPPAARVEAECSPGSYVVRRGGAEAERSCGACPSGHFSAKRNAAACSPWRECPPGSFVRREGTSIHDRDCAPCEPGTESQSPNQAACTLAGTCPAGSVRRPGGGPADCDECPPGSFCAGGSAPSLECPPSTWDNDSKASTPCVDATHCLAGERIASPPTKLSDRSCTACPSGSFSASMDAASCSAWTTCFPSTHVSVQGTSSSDRECSPCPPGTLSTSANQSACLPEGACPSGTVEREPATPTTVAVCEPCPSGFYCAGAKAPKLACPPGTFDDDANSASACVPWTTCVPGQSRGSEGTALTDRTCTSCPSGTFSVVENAPSCASWSTCEPGSRVSSSGSPTTDRSCAACATGTFSNSPNQAVCHPVGACGAGTLETSPATERTPAVCDLCESGTYCAGGAAAKIACPNGTWDDDGLSATACTPHTNCVTGERVLSSGTATFDRVCIACTTGTFSSQANAAICGAWTVCPAGSFVSSQGSTSGDRICSPCPNGTYTTAPNQSTCVPQGACPPGTEQTVAGTPTAPPVCEPCSTGFYCQGGTAPKVPCPHGAWDHDHAPSTVCAAWTSCAPGTFVSAEGSTTTNQSCSSCSSGTYTSVSNATTCTAWTNCPAGTYVSTNGTTSSDRDCSSCPNGTYSSSPNVITCITHGSCPAGTEQTAAGTATSPTQCAACQAGTYCAGGTTIKVSCGGGTWDHDLDASTPCSAWKTCLPGEYVAATGSATLDRACSACALGTFSTTSNTASCTTWTNCAPGTFMSVPGSNSTNRSCASCSSGTYSSVANATSCTTWSECSAGSYESGPPSSTSNRVCIQCTSGFTLGTFHVGSLQPSLWLDASDALSVSVVSGVVSQWSDKSGNGRHATQANATTRPAYTSAALNGQNVLTFTQDDLVVPSLALTGTGWDAFVVASLANTSDANARLLSLRTTGLSNDFNTPTSWLPLYRYSTTTQVGPFQNNSSVSPLSTISYDSVNVFHSSIKSTGLELRVNATLTGTKNSATSLDTTDGLRIGNSLNTIDENWDGIVAEIVFLQSTSTENREKLEGYFAHKWGLPQSLPSGHPYRLTPPGSSSATSCTPWTVCPAGTEQTVAGTATSDTICSRCPVGTYCAGGTSTRITCDGGTTDHDANPATPCTVGPWSPNSLSARLWLDASDSASVSTVSGLVAQWSDKSGQNSHATQSNAATRPAYTSAALNGKNTLTFTQDDLVVPSLIVTGTGWDVFVVASLESTSNAHARLLSMRTTGLTNDWNNSTSWLPLYRPGTTSTVGPFQAGSGISPFATLTYGTAYLFHSSLKSTGLELRVNAAAGGTKNSATSLNTTDGLRIGQSLNSNDENWDGSVAEIIFLATPSTENRERLEGYLAHKWGLVSQLPSNHPYKTSPP